MSRPKGSRNRSTIDKRERIEELLAEGVTPLEVIVGQMRGTMPLNHYQLQCAIAAAPYVHPKLASAEINLDATVRQCVVSDKPLTPAQWLEQYGDTSYAKIIEGVEVKVLEAADSE